MKFQQMFARKMQSSSLACSTRSRFLLMVLALFAALIQESFVEMGIARMYFAVMAQIAFLFERTTCKLIPTSSSHCASTSSKAGRNDPSQGIGEGAQR
jgi:hypothetical protein